MKFIRVISRWIDRRLHRLAFRLYQHLEPFLCDQIRQSVQRERDMLHWQERERDRYARIVAEHAKLTEMVINQQHVMGTKLFVDRECLTLHQTPQGPVTSGHADGMLRSAKQVAEESGISAMLRDEPTAGEYPNWR